jgi:hypothetical protein
MSASNHDPSGEQRLNLLMVIGVGTGVAVFALYTILLVAGSWPIDSLAVTRGASFGESFGFLEAFFSIVAVLLLIWTVSLQRHELKEQKAEMSRTVTTHQRQLHIDLLRFAFQDAELMEVWTGPAEDQGLFRRHMYVNLILSHWRAAYSQGVFDERSLSELLHEYFEKSPHFLSYWEQSHPFLGAVHLAPVDVKFHRLAQQAYETASRRRGRQ